SQSHTPTPTAQHRRGHEATTHHDPPATTVRDRTPEALNAPTSIAPSAASRPQQRRPQQRRALSSVALSSVASSAASRPQQRQHGQRPQPLRRQRLPLRESNREASALSSVEELKSSFP
ncbi:hypothetical protein HN51_040817, partial [Arachis hypogaea]